MKADRMIFVTAGFILGNIDGWPITICFVIILLVAFAGDISQYGDDK